LYSGNLTTVTDEVGNQRTTLVDGLGRVTEVLEAPNVFNYETDYAYDALGNLLSVNQRGGSNNSANWRTRTFTYDSLSRLLCAANPEVQLVTCPTSATGSFPAGAITYAYDANSNLTSKTAPLPNQLTVSATVTTSYGYDALNRLTSKSYMDGTTQDPYTPTAQFGYDATALTNCTLAPPASTDSYPKGHQTAMCDGSGATSWIHDQMGRLLQESRIIGTASSPAKQVTYGYNKDGSLASLVTPPMKTVTYTVGAAGRATQVLDTGDSITFATSATYAPPGELAGATLGYVAGGFAGFTVSNAYNMRLQPILLSAMNGATTVFGECFDFHLGVAVTQPSPCSFSKSTFGDNGNVYQIVNNRDSTRTQTFTYDTLNRITSGQSSGTQWGETFTIDPWGNLTNDTGMSGKTYAEGLNTSALANNQLSGFGYDAAGNMTSNGSSAYVYDAENRIVWTLGYRYIYDGNGQRVEKCAAAGATTACPTSGTTGTLYWRGTGSDTLDESDLGANPQEEYIFFNGQRIARRDVSSTGATIAVHYYFSNNVGSHTVIESATGTTCEQDIDYYPYGGQENDYCPNVPQHYKFTGKERDAESGLDNFNKRYFGSSLGRFMTPDPIGVMQQKLIDPQQRNMYAYVRNNPLRFTDPTGMYTCSGTSTECERMKAAYFAAERARDAAKKGSDEYKQLSSVLKFLGRPGEANYVTITFGSLKPGTLGEANTTTSAPDLLGHTHKNTEITFDLKQIDTTAKLNRRTPLWGAEAPDDAGEFVHEGTHGRDQFPGGHNPRSEAEEHSTEMNAYRNQSYVYVELGFKSMLDPGLSADTEAERNAAINAGADRSTAVWCEESGVCK
jgi:RHS repeat-associated protein